LRLAIVSTPRCGNTWFRILASFLYQVEHFAEYVPDDVAWERLPESCVLQLHWHRTDELERTLRTYGFKTTTLSRHPLDVLVSILHFASHAPTERWLAGEGGDERAITRTGPAAPEFLCYAAGPRAGTLLGVTPEWWSAGHVHRVRYEDLVAEPREAAAQLCEFVGEDPTVTIDSAVEAATIDKLRPRVSRHHFWQGQPGLWKRLVTAESANQVARAHARAFGELGYVCDPDETLTPEAANENWSRLRASQTR
jgi:hypothetical protein